MTDEVTANAPGTGATAQGNANPNPNSKSESEVLREMQVQMAALAKQANDQKTFIDRQANEIGELRKKVAVNPQETDAGKKTQEQVATEVTQEKTPEAFDFVKLTPSEQDAIKVYMREHLSKLPDAEKKVAKEALRDMSNFNMLAKEIQVKLKTPRHIEEVLGEEPVSGKEKPKNVSAEIMDAIRAELKLVDAEANATPPGGGGARGTVITKPAESNAPRRKYPNGGILNLTQ